MQAWSQFNTLSDTLAEAKAQRLFHTLGDVDMEALIDTKTDTLVE